MKKLKLRDFWDLLLTIITAIPGLILRLKKGNLWIISERRDEARDNGYWLFKYAQTHHSAHVYYAIDYDSPDFGSVSQIGSTVRFGGFKHHLYTWATTKYISTQYSNGMPSRVMFYLWLWRFLPVKFCFLQHGVTKDKSYYLMQPAKRVSLFCCVSEVEQKFAISLGYSKKAAQVTGFCRYDALTNMSIVNKQILIMLTWRKYLVGLSEEEFSKSSYYHNMMAMINDPILKKIFGDTKFVVYAHPGMRKYLHLFRSDLDNVVILDEFDVDFNYLICSSSAYITDYSSLAFDFAYLGKPVCYFQFDDTEFRDKHLQEGYFKYLTDGFGPLFTDHVPMLKYLFDTKLKQEPIYAQRSEDFFEFHDKLNCGRVLRAIEAI